MSPTTASKATTDSTLLTVTERAAQELKTALAGEKETYAGLRLGLQSGGCCGPGYVLALAKQTETDDLVVESQGLKFFVANTDAQALKGAKIDFVETPMGSGFHIDNPNIVKEEHEHGHGHGGCGSGGCGGGGCGCAEGESKDQEGGCGPGGCGCG